MLAYMTACGTKNPRHSKQHQEDMHIKVGLLINALIHISSYFT